MKNQSGNYIVGVDQLIVDIEAHVSEDFLKQNDIPKGESIVCSDEFVDGLIKSFGDEVVIAGEFAGGAIGNTLHNFSVLSDNEVLHLERSVKIFLLVIMLLNISAQQIVTLILVT